MGETAPSKIIGPTRSHIAGANGSRLLTLEGEVGVCHAEPGDLTSGDAQGPPSTSRFTHLGFPKTHLELKRMGIHRRDLEKVRNIADYNRVPDASVDAPSRFEDYIDEGAPLADSDESAMTDYNEELGAISQKLSFPTRPSGKRRKEMAHSGLTTLAPYYVYRGALCGIWKLLFLTMFISDVTICPYAEYKAPLL